MDSTNFYNERQDHGFTEIFSSLSTDKSIKRENLLKEYQRVLDIFDSLNSQTYLSENGLNQLNPAITALREKLENLKKQIGEKMFESEFGAFYREIETLFKKFSTYVERNNFERDIDTTFAYTEAITALTQSFRDKVKALYNDTQKPNIQPEDETLVASPYEIRIRDWCSKRKLNSDELIIIDRSIARNPALQEVRLVRIVPPDIAPTIIKKMGMSVLPDQVLVTPAGNEKKYLTVPLAALLKNLLKN